ncbi:MAG: TatD family hydrolase [Gammaproteobacteria bacterium]|nr:TatD family hydrolase [Gammaproteobacteria bacterium]
MKESSGLVDFHCHLDLLPDLETAYQRCDEIGCTTLTMTTTPKAFPRNRVFAERSTHVRAALGLHPQLVSERGHEIELFEQLLPSTRYVGEIGLDAGKQFYSSFAEQQRVFDRAIAACADQGEKIISVHSARCARKVLDVIESRSVTDSCQVILHWFSAGKAEIDRAVRLGCWFSINQRMMASPSGLSIIEQAPRESLLTETDAPFLEIEKCRVEPGEVSGTLALIANALDLTDIETRSLIASNARRLLDEK